MNIKRQLTIRFIIQLAVAGLIVLLIAAITAIWVMQRFVDIRVSHDFASVGLAQLVESSEMSESGVRFAPHLLEQVKKNGGWLQSIDEKGIVENSYNTPSDVPKQYNPGELTSYWTGTQPFPYRLYLWIQDKNGKQFTLLYGEPNEREQLLSVISSEGSMSTNGVLVLPADEASRLEQLNGYVQLLHSDGSELASYNRPSAAPIEYTLQDLALRTMYNERYGVYLSSSYEKETGRTWVISIPYAEGTALGHSTLLPAEERTILIGILAMLIAILCLFLLLSLWQAHRFGAPMDHMLTWLNALGRAEFKEPVNHKGHNRSRTRSGKWKRRFLVFAGVMHAIDKLSATLQRDKALRQQTDHLREEWIEGITHDMKTPLVSIKGYAHLLVEPQYNWSTEEVRKFSSNILEKSAHMDMLISDLSMSYRLKSGIHPPGAEEIELNHWLCEAIKQAAADPTYGSGRIRFQPAPDKVIVSLYTPWLERVVTNLTANSLLHNPPDTVLTVSIVTGERGNELTIQFSDNGTGMDEGTLSILFERYYRGTSTAANPNGTGLGMAISKGLIEAMGGRITVETSLGKGTVIRLIFL